MVKHPVELSLLLILSYKKNLATFINHAKTQNLTAWRSIFPTQYFSCLEKLCCIATLIRSVTLNTIIHNICVHSQCDQWELIFHSQDKLSSSRMKASVSMMYKHVFPFGLREASSKQGIRNRGITAKLPLVRNQLLVIYLPVAKELYPRYSCFFLSSLLATPASSRWVWLLNAFLSI